MGLIYCILYFNFVTFVCQLFFFFSFFLHNILYRIYIFDYLNKKDTYMSENLYSRISLQNIRYIAKVSHKDIAWCDGHLVCTHFHTRLISLCDRMRFI